MTDIGHGLASGLMVGLPTMLGQATQAFTPEDSDVNRFGKSMVELGKSRENKPEYQTTGAWGEGAKSVVPSLAALAGAWAAAPLGTAAAAVGGGAAAAALFGGSTYTDVKERALQAGATPDVAQAQAMKAGMVMGAGQAAAAAVGGKVLSGAGGALVNKFVAKGGVQNAIESFSNPAMFKTFAKGFAEMMGVQLPVQAGTAAAMNEIEQGAGIDTKQTSWEAAKASLAPTATMTTLLAPVSAFGAYRSNQERARIAKVVAGSDPTATPEQRTAALAQMAREMRTMAPKEDVSEWQQQALLAIADGKPVDMRADFTHDATEHVDYSKTALPEDQPDYALAQHELDNRPPEPNYEAAQRQLENQPEPVDYDVAQSKLDAPDYAAAQQDLERRENPRLPAPTPPAIALPDANAPKKIEEPAYPPTKEGETKYIRALHELPSSTPGTVIDKLRGLDHAQQLDELTKLYDPNKDTKWMEAVGDTLKKVGRLDEEGKPNENIPANESNKAPAENRPGAEPQPAAVQAEPQAAGRAVEVADAQRNAEAGRAAGAAAQADAEVRHEPPTAAEGAKALGATEPVETPAFPTPAGDTNALIPRQEINRQERASGGVGGQVAQAGDSNRAVGSPARRTEAQVKAAREGLKAQNIDKGVKQASVHAEAEKRVREVADQLSKWRDGTQALVDKYNALLGKQKLGTLTKEDFARMQKLQQEIPARRTQEEQMVNDHSDAVGEAEKQALHQFEPAHSAGYFSFAHPNAIEGGGPAHTYSYLEAKKVLGTASPEEMATVRSLKGTLRGNPRAQEEARLALQEMEKTPLAKAIWEGRAQRLVRAVKTAAEAIRLEAENREATMRSLEQDLTDKREFNRWLRDNDTNFEKGHITPEEHEANILELMAKAVYQHGMKNRGLAGLDDAKLATKVAENTHATAVMQHIASNHHNPLVRTIAKMLAKADPNARIVVVDNPDFDGGRYVPASHTVEIGRGGMNSVTLMHEVMHSLTHAALYRAMDNIHRAPTELDGRANREIAALKTIRDVMGKFAKVADLSNPAHRLALEDEHEFLSEALNNPEIQETLGGHKWMTKVWNALRTVLGMDKIKQTDFERLMEAAPTLFGDPKRSSLDVFHSALDRTAVDRDGNFTRTPAGAVASMKSVGGQLAQKVTEMALKGDTRAAIRAGFHRWTTYNNSAQWLQRRSTAIKEKFPEHAALLDRFYKAFIAPKGVMERRSASSQHLLNAPEESSDVARALGKLQKERPAMMNAMAEFAHRARDSQIDPRLKSFAEAKFRSPKLKQEQWDAAKPLRDEYARMHPDIKAAYDRVLLHNGLSHTRHYAGMLDTINKTWGMGNNPELDWVTHTKVRSGPDVGRSQLDPKVQHDALNKAMTDAKSAVDARLKSAGFDPESKAGKEATAHKEAVDSLFEEYNRQRAIPYVHRGRSGDYMIHFEVGGGTAEWEAVRKIVTGATKDGGLDRDMGPEVGDNRHVDMRFDNEMHHVAAIKRLSDLEKAGTFKTAAGENTFAAGLVAGRYKTTDGATPTFVRKLKSKIDADETLSADAKEAVQRQITDTYLQQMPESSPLKATMQSDNTAGASKDFLKTFSDRQEMSNRALVGSQMATRMGDAMSELDSVLREIRSTPGLSGETANELGLYANEVRARVKDSETPVNTPGFDTMRAIAAPFRLALSPAYMLMTAYQPLQMTLPFLGKDHGFVKSGASMARNYGKAYGALNELFKSAWDLHDGDSKWQRLLATASPTMDFSRLKNKNGTYMFQGAELELMNHLQMSGLLNFGQMQQIWRMQAPGEEHAVSKAVGAVKNVNQMASAMPHYIEMSNRLVAALSAHELALEKTGDKEYARKYAMDTIRNTDGDHSQGNIARALGRRGFLRGATPLVVGFNQYDFQMTESLSRLLVTAFGKGEEATAARKGLGYVALMTGLMAGTLGLPFMGLMTGLYNQIVGGFQDDSSTPPDFEKSVRDAMDGIFGEKGGEIVSRGVPRLLDIDMSTRSGYQDLAPFTSFLEDRQKLGDRIKDQALNFLGPAVGIGVGAATGARALYEGNYPQAINDALPAFARNAAKAWRLSQYGYEREGGGNEQIPLKVSSWNIIAQAGGFGSGAKAEQGEKQFQWNTNQKLMQAREAIIRNNWLRAMDHGDAAGVGSAMEQLITFATDQPQYAHGPGELGSAMRQRMMSVEMARQFGGIHVGKRSAPFLEQFQNQGGAPTMAPRGQ